jgi:hypothetical protein
MDSYFPEIGDDNEDDGRSASNRSFSVSPHSHAKKPVQEQTGLSGGLPIVAAAIKPARKRNVMVVNGEEIELDEDEDEHGGCLASDPAPETAACAPVRKRNVMIINGEEVEIDDEEPYRSSLLHCNSTKNDKPPEPKARVETKSSSSSSSCLPSPPLTPSINDDNSSRPPGCHSQPINGPIGSPAKPAGTAIGCGAGEFGLHLPLRFKRRSNNNTLQYTGSS